MTPWMWQWAGIVAIYIHFVYFAGLIKFRFSQCIDNEYRKKCRDMHAFYVQLLVLHKNHAWQKRTWHFLGRFYNNLNERLNSVVKKSLNQRRNIRSRWASQGFMLKAVIWPIMIHFLQIVTWMENYRIGSHTSSSYNY